MPESMKLIDAAVAGQIFSSGWSVIAANFAGVAVLIGAVFGLKKLAKIINGGLNGKVRA